MFGRQRGKQWLKPARRDCRDALSLGNWHDICPPSWPTTGSRPSRLPGPAAALTVWCACPRVCEAQQRAHAPGAVHQRLAPLLWDSLVHPLRLCGQQLHVLNDIGDAAVPCIRPQGRSRQWLTQTHLASCLSQTQRQEPWHGWLAGKKGWEERLLQPNYSRRTCRQLADCVEQLKLPALLDVGQRAANLLGRRLNEELQAKAVDVVLACAPHKAAAAAPNAILAAWGCGRWASCLCCLTPSQQRLPALPGPHPPSWMSSKGSLSPSLTIMTLPLGRWMTRKFCRTAGHLGPAITEVLAGLCPSANGSRLPRLRHTRSRAVLLCSTSSSTARADGQAVGREQHGRMPCRLLHPPGTKVDPARHPRSCVGALGRPTAAARAAPVTDGTCGCSRLSGCRYWSCLESCCWPQHEKQSRSEENILVVGIVSRCTRRLRGLCAGPRLGCLSWGFPASARA